MAKKAKGKTAKQVKTAKKMTAAKKVGKGVDRVKALAKKPAKRGKKKPTIDPELEAARARNRAMWKSQEQEATSIELAKHGTLVDERARVRSNIGMSWSNRKPH